MVSFNFTFSYRLSARERKTIYVGHKSLCKTNTHNKAKRLNAKSIAIAKLGYCEKFITLERPIDVITKKLI